MSDSTLDDILSDDTKTEPEPKAEAPEEQPKAEEPEGEPKEEPEAEDPPEDTGEDDAPTPGATKDVMVPLRALEDERSKRQEAEKRLAAQEQPERPDALEDPEGAAKHIEGSVDQKLADMRAEISLQMAEATIPDFTEVMGPDLEHWKSLANENPALLQQVMASPLPGKAAYDVVKQYRALSAIGDDPAAYEAKIRADERAKIEQEQKAKKADETASSLPNSLADAPSKGERKGPEWAGPPPLDEVLGG